MKSYFLIFLLVVTFFLSTSCTEKNNIKMSEITTKSFNKPEPFLVKIISNKDDGDVSFGTGFAVVNSNQKKYILTAAHVVENKTKEDPIPIKTSKNQDITAFIYLTEDNQDFAILEVIDMTNLVSCCMKLADDYEISESGGDEFMVSGFSDMAIPKVLDSSANTPNLSGLNLIFMNLHLPGGMSGSPVYSKTTGHVIGMIKSSTDSQTEAVPARILSIAIDGTFDKSVLKNPKTDPDDYLKPDKPTEPQKDFESNSGLSMPFADSYPNEDDEFITKKPTGSTKICTEDQYKTLLSLNPLTLNNLSLQFRCREIQKQHIRILKFLKKIKLPIPLIPEKEASRIRDLKNRQEDLEEYQNIHCN